MTGALVLSGGGLAGIAWEIGVLAGIADEAPTVIRAIMRPSVTFLGTSAGSAVASQLAGGGSLESLFAVQVAPETSELGADFDPEAFSRRIAALMAGATSAEEVRQRIGRFARSAETVPSADRRAVIAARLQHDNWPARRLLITAVNAVTGEFRLFDRDSGVQLIDAVSASCAVPGVWPTVEIDGVHYMDGGTRSTSNADQVAGCDPILILTPSRAETPMGQAIGQAELAALDPAMVTSVFADEASLGSFGVNPLDPAVRPAAAMAGRAQGRRVAEELQSLWR